MIILTFLVFIFNLIQSVHSKYVEGSIITYDNWVFVARFCFLSKIGQLEYLIEYPSNIGTLNLLLYYDTENQWHAVYKTNKTCLDKEAVLSIDRSQVVNLTMDYPLSGCKQMELLQNSFKHNIIHCNYSRNFLSARERWWYIAVSKCRPNATQGINFRFKFLMTNGQADDYWHYHLSVDEFYVLPILIAFSVVYLFVIIAVIVFSIELKARQFLHATYKLFMASVFLQEAGIISQCIHYVRYSVNGIGYPKLKDFGRIFEAISECCFLVLMLLLAKGFTVTRAKLRLASSIKMTIFVCGYVVCTFALFIYEKMNFDPGEVLYLYESPPGYGIITLRMIAWWMFIYSTIFTLKHYPEKAPFYYPFNLLGTIWFVATPIFVLAANNLIDKWVRESVVYGVSHAIAFGGHLIFLMLTIPSKANKNFPYHVRTNQIGIMAESGVSGNNTVYRFGHHNYAPSTRPVPIELFTVSKTVDIGSTINLETNNGYIQTILVPFTIRDNDSDSENSIGRPSTPKDESNISKSATIIRSTVGFDNRKVVSAGEQRKDDAMRIPSAPYLEDDERPHTASTLSANTAETLKLGEEQISIKKLTDMFVAQSFKTAV